MEKTTIHVEGMTCGHCKQSVEKALQELPGVAKVEVNLQAGEAAVEYDGGKATVQDMKDAIEEQGYDVK